MLAGKAAGGANKFSAGAGQTGVVEAIDGALNSKVRGASCLFSPRYVSPLAASLLIILRSIVTQALSGAHEQDEFAAEEAFYKSLLREVIEARAAGTGAASGIDVGQLRSEKKKKRDAERGASKGRKIRCVWRGFSPLSSFCAFIPGLMPNLIQVYRPRKGTKLYRADPAGDVVGDRADRRAVHESARRRGAGWCRCGKG